MERKRKKEKQIEFSRASIRLLLIRNKFELCRVSFRRNTRNLVPRVKYTPRGGARSFLLCAKLFLGYKLFGRYFLPKPGLEHSRNITRGRHFKLTQPLVRLSILKRHPISKRNLPSMKKKKGERKTREAKQIARNLINASFLLINHLTLAVSTGFTNSPSEFLFFKTLNEVIYLFVPLPLFTSGYLFQDQMFEKGGRKRVL